MTATTTLNDARLLLESAEKLVDLAIERATSITDGGKCIDDHQVLTERVSYAATECRAARALVDFTTELVDAGRCSEMLETIAVAGATDLVESSTNVVMLPVSQSLLNNLDTSTRVLTPNGDGVNDDLVAVFDLVNVLVPRPLTFSVFDLSGRRVHNVDLDATAGRTEFSWDGRNDDGNLVPPGLYIVDITVSGDTGDRSSHQVVSVAY